MKDEEYPDVRLVPGSIRGRKVAAQHFISPILSCVLFTGSTKKLSESPLSTPVFSFSTKTRVFLRLISCLIHPALLPHPLSVFIQCAEHGELVDVLVLTVAELFIDLRADGEVANLYVRRRNWKRECLCHTISSRCLTMGSECARSTCPANCKRSVQNRGPVQRPQPRAAGCPHHSVGLEPTNAMLQ